jgi:hypothetical protein
VNALFERPNPYGSGVSQHGLDVRLPRPTGCARATGLDMVAAGWRPTVGNYLGRVTKPRILEAVREGAGERAAQLIDHLKKGDMAKEAERLLADTGWLPEPLRLIDPHDGRSSNGRGGRRRRRGRLAGLPQRGRRRGCRRDRGRGRPDDRGRMTSRRGAARGRFPHLRKETFHD